MNRFVVLTLCFLCLTCVHKNKASEIVKLMGEYIPEEKLSEWNFVKPTQNTEIYKLVFKEDSLPYIATEDSLFNINLNNDMFVLYYNCNLLRNTGFIIYGNRNEKKVQVIQTGKILLCEVFLIDSQQPLMKIIEIVDYDYGDFLILQNHYFLFYHQTHLLQRDLSVLCYASFLQDTSKIQLKDNITSSQVIIQGMQDNKEVVYNLKIENGDFLMSKSEENISWNGMKVLKKDNVFSRVMHY